MAATTSTPVKKLKNDLSIQCLEKGPNDEYTQKKFNIFLNIIS